MDERGARDPWVAFQHDPRDPAVAPLRASDADRNVVHSVLVDAFADGRLDREEYDERTAAAMRARTLGELPPLISDLVPDRPLLPGKVPLSVATKSDLQQRGLEKWRHDRREAFMGLVGSALITWTIWFIFTRDVFYWPLIVNAFATINLIRVMASKSEIVASEVKRLERRQAKAIESQHRKRQSGS